MRHKKLPRPDDIDLWISQKPKERDTGRPDWDRDRAFRNWLVNSNVSTQHISACYEAWTEAKKRYGVKKI